MFLAGPRRWGGLGVTSVLSKAGEGEISVCFPISKAWKFGDSEVCSWMARNPPDANGLGLEPPQAGKVRA